MISTHCQEVSATAGFVFEEPIFSKGAVLDIAQNLFHSGFGILRNDFRAGCVVAVFSSITDGFTHFSHAAFVHEVDDQFHFMERFKICDFRLIACFTQCFKAIGN